MGTKRKQPALGAELKRLQEKYDLRQQDMADLFGIAQPNMSLLQSSKRPPTTCWRIAIAYMDEYGMELLRKK